MNSTCNSELAYQEYRTSALVADVHTSYGGTGVVGVLSTGDGLNIGLVLIKGPFQGAPVRKWQCLIPNSVFA
jgi:hypothetical protein